jgi:Uma2 family endonuclease
MTSRAFDPQPILYPDSDGQPMADNTLQFEWIVMLKQNLDQALPGFVAGDLLWYPVDGRPEERIAPDVLVAPDRPKGYRGSYQQWREEGQAPAVVMEVLSPGNTIPEMLRKLGFYDRHGVDEFYVVDPELEVVEVFTRTNGGGLREVPWVGTFDSPRLGIRFTRVDERLLVHHADGRRFETFAEIQARVEALASERDHLATERDHLATERDALLARLRAAGLEP